MEEGPWFTRDPDIYSLTGPCSLQVPAQMPPSQRDPPCFSTMVRLISLPCSPLSISVYASTNRPYNLLSLMTIIYEQFLPSRMETLRKQRSLLLITDWYNNHNTVWAPWVPGYLTGVGLAPRWVARGQALCSIAQTTVSSFHFVEEHWFLVWSWNQRLHLIKLCF